MLVCCALIHVSPTLPALVIIHGPRQAKKYLRTCAKYAQNQFILRMRKVSAVVVSNDSVNGQWRPWSDCADAQADLGLRCQHMPGPVFPCCRPYSLFWNLRYAWQNASIMLYDPRIRKCTVWQMRSAKTPVSLSVARSDQSSFGILWTASDPKCQHSEAPWSYERIHMLCVP